MSDSYPKLRVAAVQAAPVFLDREATTRKACELIEQAGANGARFIVFPECYIPAFPYWFHWYAWNDPVSQRCCRELFASSVEVPSSTTERLGAAARQAGAYVVMGINERRPEIMGTMYNAQVFLGPDGRIIGKRRKVMPTGTERLVHGMGDGTSLTVFPSEFGPMGGLICGENGNPLLAFALAAQGERLHAAGWPAKTGTAFSGGIENMVLRSRGCAMQVNHFGVHAAAVFTPEMCDAMELSQEVRKGMVAGGGSCVIAPDGQLLAGPAGGEETIVYADVDLGAIVASKLMRDFSGHYNRFDLVRVVLNTIPNEPLRITSAEAGLGSVAESGDGFETGMPLEAR